jgi:hypothetical protein
MLRKQLTWLSAEKKAEKRAIKSKAQASGATKAK